MEKRVILGYQEQKVNRGQEAQTEQLVLQDLRDKKGQWVLLETLGQKELKDLEDQEVLMDSLVLLDHPERAEVPDRAGQLDNLDKE